MSILVAAIACIVLLVVGELARYLVARALGVPVVRVAKCCVGLRGGRRWARAVAIFAGTLTTYLGIVVLAFALYCADGVPTTNLRVTVDNVVAGYPAHGHLEAGDHIIALDGAPITRSLNSLVDERNGAAVKLTVVRGGDTREETLRPIGHDGHWLLGFHPIVDAARTYDTGPALWRALGFPIVQLSHLVPPLLPGEHAEPGGPVRVAIYHPPPASLFVVALRQALILATYLLVLIVIVDVVRAARAVRATA